jgi:hypothetical protein
MTPETFQVGEKLFLNMYAQGYWPKDALSLPHLAVVEVYEVIGSGLNQLLRVMYEGNLYNLSANKFVRQPKADKAVRQAFILDWFKADSQNYCTDSCNKGFHDAYNERFPGYPVEVKLWGASPVRQAMVDLKEMADDGVLERQRIGMSNWQPGFPKWVWSYTLRKTV